MSNFDSMTPDQIDFDSEENDSFSMQQCPVAEQADNALKSSVEARQAIRRFRQTLLNCDMCPLFSRCDLREEFNVQIDLVIAEILEEWGW